MIRYLLIALVLSLTCRVQAQSLDSLVVNLANRDSLYEFQFQALDSIQNDASQFYSKLKHHYDSVEQKYSSIASDMQHQVDSLNKVQLPANHLVQKLDSINQVKEEQVSIIKSKVEEIKSNTIGRIDQLNLPPELKTKIEEYTGAIDKLDLSMPTSNLRIPRLNLSDNLNLSIPGSNNALTDGLPNLSTSTIPNVDGITETTSQLRELNQVVPEDITNPDQLAKTVERQVIQIEEVSAVQEQLGNLPVNSLSSEEQAKQELLHQAKEAAVDHFAGKEQELKGAMDQLSKYKKKYASINSLSEITKKRPNEMKGKPLIERIVPGIALQIQKKNAELLVDFNPYAGYRFTGRIVGGMGWNQRISFTINNNSFNKAARIYGPRAFGEYTLRNGFSPRAEVETMNTFVPPFVRTSPVDIGDRQWVWGVFVGMKKDYKFLKKINGTAQVMFRLFDPDRKSPYADAVNARFGFEFPMKKKTKNAGKQ